MSAFELFAAVGGTLLAAAALLWITRHQRTGSVASSAPPPDPASAPDATEDEVGDARRPGWQTSLSRERGIMGGREPGGGGGGGA